MEKFKPLSFYLDVRFLLFKFSNFFLCHCSGPWFFASTVSLTVSFPIRNWHLHRPQFSPYLVFSLHLFVLFHPLVWFNLLYSKMSYQALTEHHKPQLRNTVFSSLSFGNVTREILPPNYFLGISLKTLTLSILYSSEKNTHFICY